MIHKRSNDNKPTCTLARRRGARQSATITIGYLWHAAERRGEIGRREAHRSVPSDWLLSSGIDYILNFCNIRAFHASVSYVALPFAQSLVLTLIFYLFCKLSRTTAVLPRGTFFLSFSSLEKKILTAYSNIYFRNI